MSTSEQAIKAEHYDAIAAALEQAGMAGTSVVDSVQVLILRSVRRCSAPAEPACYGIRRNGSDAIIGVIPLKIAATRPTCEEYLQGYNEVPLFTHPKVPTWGDEAMARHWIDRYAAGLDDEPQMDLILECVANPWREAVLDALANTGGDAPLDESPAEIIARVIAFNVCVATDPAIASPEAQPFGWFINYPQKMPTLAYINAPDFTRDKLVADRMVQQVREKFDSEATLTPLYTFLATATGAPSK